MAAVGKNNKRIVVVGAGGRLGAALLREYREQFEVVGFNHAQLDLGAPEQFGATLDPIEFHALINAVEPNHGELDLIHTDGRIRCIPDISESQGHIVPGYDGVNFFIGNLGTFPIVDGSEVILKITGSGKVETFATGFTTILGLAFDSHGKLYVLENTTGGNEFPTPGTGKILRLSHDGARTEIATGLNLPTAMTFGADGNIYVSSWGFGPPAMGEIDKVTLPK